MPTKQSVESLIANWQAGMLTDGEMVTRLVERVKTENTAELLHGLPPAVLGILRECVAAAPMTDEGWNQMLYVESDCGTKAPAERERRHTAHRGDFRAGVESLRKEFERQGERDGKDRNSG